MNKRLAISLLLLLSSCAGENSNEHRVAIQLMNDFQYARQANEGVRKHNIFTNGDTLIRNKRKRALVQHSPGQIAFFVKLDKRPVLKLFPHIRQLRNAPKGMVRVRSDYPSSLERSFPVQWNQPIEMDLQEFEGRTAAIEFSAKTNRRKGFKNPVYWINPVTEGTVAENKQPPQEAIQDFQKRHRNDNLLIVIFDAATASHFGCYGYSKPTTPFVDSFAAESVLWENAFTQAVYTIASTGTLLTGQYPNVHQVIGHGMALNEKFKTMTEALRDAGFRTALFTGNNYASPKIGYGQGFEQVSMPQDGLVRANDFVKPVTRWLDENRDRPFFAYIHFREPHYPFTSPPEYLRQFRTDLDFQLPITDNKLQRDEEERRKITAAYDANLAFVDREFSRILQHLKQRGLMEKTIIMLLSDHGEAFWQHRVQGHNYSLYEEVMRIPLIMRFPREEGLRGVRRKQPAGTLQIFPTVAEIFQLSTRNLRWPSPSLVPVILRNDAIAQEFIFSQAAGQKGYAVRSAEFKYIRYAKREYDEMFLLKEDPKETRNRIGEYPIVAGYCRLALEKILKEMRSSAQKAPQPETVVVDKEWEEQLRTLGYLQ